jgi:thiamine pyrophosphate-dependent acetolactate synthase large subunit-like protein
MNFDDVRNVERPTRDETVRPEWGSDVIAEVLRRLGIEFIALNPGSSYRHLHDSLVNYLGNRSPQMLMVLHEEHAIAIAHGYAKVTGKPMAAAVHSNVGLMHATMAIYNAWCDRVPVMVLGANGPVDAPRRRPWIDWIHTTRDQAALIRNFLKWDDEPVSPAAAVESILRAWQLARQSPCGPVYVCFSVEVQEAKLSGEIALPDPARYQPGTIPAPSSDSLAKVAEFLIRARRPVILMGCGSRRQENWDNRIRLAELLNAKVITDIKAGAAFPTSHPLHICPPGLSISRPAIEAIGEADLILSLGWIDLAGTLKIAYPDKPVPKVIQISNDSYNHRGWAADYMSLPPADVSILCEPDTMLAPLCEAVSKLRRRKPESNWTPRSGGAGIVRNSHFQVHGRSDEPIAMSDIARSLGSILGERRVSLLRVPLGWSNNYYDFTGPLDYLGYDGGAGIGSGPGMTVGAALALRDSGYLPIAILGDGDYLMGVTALWTAAKYRIPFLVIVANNQSFYNDEVHQENVARQRGRLPENKWIGQKIIEPAIDLAAMARGQGVEGVGPVSRIGDMPEALERAIRTVEAGAACVVDVVVKPGYESKVA